jgi:hypothetical protein
MAGLRIIHADSLVFQRAITAVNDCGSTIASIPQSYCSVEIDLHRLSFTRTSIAFGDPDIGIGALRDSPDQSAQAVQNDEQWQRSRASCRPCDYVAQCDINSYPVAIRNGRTQNPHTRHSGHARRQDAELTQINVASGNCRH